MKRLTTGTAIALCTFIIGIIAVAVWLVKPVTDPVTPALIENPSPKQTIMPAKHSPISTNLRDTKELCNLISEIKFLPMKNERGYDEAYDSLIEAGESVVPCLIEKVTDTTIMPDPRGTRISQETKVGDVAYFVLLDIAKIDFLEMLPEKVKEKYKTEGAYAYHDYIEKKGNRKKLKLKLLEWETRRHIN